MNTDVLRLCLVTDSRMLAGRRLEDIVLSAVQGGCTMVQLREKEADTRTFLDRALCLKHLLCGTGVPLIINDRLDIALAIHADGVHLGQSDMPVATARELLGPQAIIGLSVEDLDQVSRANEEWADYIGISPIFTTATKADIHQPFGAEGTRRVVRLSTHPTIGIGGINHHTVTEAMTYGIDGVAVVSDIMQSPDPQAAAHILRTAVDTFIQHSL